MSRSRLTIPLLAVAGLCLIGPSPARADEMDIDLASKIILKIMMLDREIQAKCGGEIVVGVIGSGSATRAFRALKGEPIDKGGTVRVARVIELKKLPPEIQPTFVFVGKNADPKLATKYTRDKHVLSVTNVPDYVIAGVTLGIGVENNRPKVLLNLTGSEAERMNWDPKILKISKTIK